MSSNLDAADDHQNVRSGAQQHYEEKCSQEAVTGHLWWAQTGTNDSAEVVICIIFEKTARSPSRVTARLRSGDSQEEE